MQQQQPIEGPVRVSVGIPESPATLPLCPQDSDGAVPHLRCELLLLEHLSFQQFQLGSLLIPPGQLPLQLALPQRLRVSVQCPSRKEKGFVLNPCTPIVHTSSLKKLGI